MLGEAADYTMWMRRVSEMDVSVLVRCWITNSIWCRSTEAGGHWANHPRPDGELIPTPGNASSADPVRDASLSR